MLKISVCHRMDISCTCKFHNVQPVASLPVELYCLFRIKFVYNPKICCCACEKLGFTYSTRTPTCSLAYEIAKSQENSNGGQRVEICVSTVLIFVSNLFLRKCHRLLSDSHLRFAKQKRLINSMQMSIRIH